MWLVTDTGQTEKAANILLTTAGVLPTCRREFSREEWNSFPIMALWLYGTVCPGAV